MKELSKLTKTESAGTKSLGTITPAATGSDERVDAEAATGSSSLLGPQYHAEGGLTDGCYALYNNSDVGQVDHVLTQIQVGSWRRRIRRPRNEREATAC